MSRSALSALVFLAITSKLALAQPDPADPTPLVSKTYAYPSGIPYQVDPVTSAIRGPQYGYNECNSTTQNQNSLCQTSIVNNIADFCLWAPPNPNSTIGDTEGYEVAWCTKSGHGTRLIPAGVLQAVQVLVTSEYIQYSGLINQVELNMAASDYGGELDPHGADLRGNPIGSLVYSNAFSGNNSTEQQVIDWNEQVFIGGFAFCLTICSPNSSESDQSAYCQNQYDEIGCEYNMPAHVVNGTFEVCDADLKTPVGVYTSGGATHTWVQPFTGAYTVPYPPPSPPASSNCQTYHSTDLYTALPTVTSASASQTGRASSASSASAGAPSATANGAPMLGVSFATGILGTLLAVTFLA